MIDLSTETPIPLKRVPEHLPVNAAGKRVAYSTLCRWITVGVKSVVLETTNVGGRVFTSKEALDRFFAAIDRASGRKAPAPTTEEPQPRTAGEKHRQERARIASESLAAKGW